MAHVVTSSILGASWPVSAHSQRRGCWASSPALPTGTLPSAPARLRSSRPVGPTSWACSSLTFLVGTNAAFHPVAQTRNRPSVLVSFSP